MREEIFDICDQHDQVIGQATRSEVHAHGWRHRAVHIWVWRNDGRLMIHLRSASKDEYPLCYTSSASGHVDADEDYETAAHRELREELNLSGPLRFVTKLPASPMTAMEHTVLYELCSDEIPEPDPDEIAGLEYLLPEELAELLAQRPEHLSPPFRELLKDWWSRSTGRTI